MALRWFDFEVVFARDELSQPLDSTARQSDAPSLSTALQEQLGLKLEAITAPIDVLVVDQIGQLIPD